jgi:hypothetical protein
MANITLVLNEAEQQALCSHFDSVLRQTGLNALHVVSHFMGRILAAQSVVMQFREADAMPSEAEATEANANVSATIQREAILSHPGGEIPCGKQSQSEAEAHEAAHAESPAGAGAILRASLPEAPEQATHPAAASALAAAQ